METACATIARICRYPVKGMSAEPVPSVAVTAGEGLPLDRTFALARPGAPFDPERPAWLSKRHFLMLMSDERLAALRVAYDDGAGRLTVDHDRRREVDADLRTDEGRGAIERFFENYMGAGLGGRPRLVSAPGHMFTDSATRYVSLINLASVADLERRLGRPVDPVRFRANLYITGLAAWRELEWLDRDLGAGAVRFRAAKRIDRCAATNVDPATGQRDLNVPLAILEAFGHIDCGLRVLRGGELAVGQAVAPG
jgi:uncharacterized protein YcbX